jgi:GT2 family glycosyltransferase
MNTELPRNSLIAVVMLTVNQQENTVRCLSSFAAVAAPEFDIVLWDNGSNDGTADYVREKFPTVLVHHSPKNLGAAGGRNAGAELAIETYQPEFLLFIDNDTVVTPGFLSALLEPFHDDDKLGQTSAKIKFLKDPERLNDAGGSNIQYWLGRTTPIGYNELDTGQYDKPTRCVAPTCCTLVRTSVFREISGFDTAFDPYGYEDLDLSLRIFEAEYYALYVPDAVIYHDPSQTFESGQFTEKYAQHKARNWFLFMRRHAPAWKQLAFWIVGAPLILVRMLRSNDEIGFFRKLGGLLRGMFHVRRNPQR